MERRIASTVVWISLLAGIGAAQVAKKPPPTATAASFPRVYGRVVRDGDPLPGVRVAALAVGTTKVDELVATRTDPEGRFELRVLPVLCAILAFELPSPVGPRYSPPLRLTWRQEFDFGDVPMDAPCRIRGRLVDPHGQPVAGAAVEIRSKQMETPPVRGAICWFKILPSTEPTTVESAADGTFEYSDLRPGLFEVAVRDPSGREALRAAWPDSTRSLVDFGDVQMMVPAKRWIDTTSPPDTPSQPTRKVDLVLRDSDRQPVAGALIEADWVSGRARNSIRAISNAEGRVVFDCEERSVTFRISHPEFETSYTDRPLWRESSVSVGAPAGVPVHGSVRDADDERPSQWIRVVVPKSGDVTVDSRGRFTLPPTRPNVKRIAFVRWIDDGSEPAIRGWIDDGPTWIGVPNPDRSVGTEFENRERGDPMELLVLAATPSKLNGRVVADGQPLENAIVIAEHLSGIYRFGALEPFLGTLGHSPTVRTDADGRFHMHYLRTLDWGDWDLSVIPFGHDRLLPGARARLRRGGAPTAVHIDLGTASIRGRVRWEGQPAQVSSGDLSGMLNQSEEFDPHNPLERRRIVFEGDGSFVCSWLPEGRHFVRLYFGNEWQPRRRVEVERGANVDLGEIWIR